MSGLAAQAGELLSGRHPVWAAVRVTPSGVELASVGPSDHATWEIGSVTKTITGQLWHVALERREITRSTLLREVLDVSGPVGDLTLASLSSHTAGLPRLANGREMVRRTWELYRRGANPYREDLAALLEQAGDVRPGRPTPSYSNLGYQLLGHAVAAAAGTTYRQLVQERYADPLGLRDTYVPYAASDLRAGAVASRNRRGREVEPWAGESVAPAGGVRSSAADLALVLRALLDGTAPGIAALDPFQKFVGQAWIGAAWLTMPVKGRTVTWHNGGTGGFRSCLVLDRKAHVGVAVLSATTRSVDGPTFRLLEETR